jgi:hypothetical protein
MTPAEGNKIIAEFMGGHVQGYDLNFRNVPVFHNMTFGDWITIDEIKFHTSWEWQIPVWAHLHKLIKSYQPQESTIRPQPLHADYDKAIEANNVFFQYHKFREGWKHKALEDNNTIAAFEILVKEIQWYNKIKQQ